MLKRFRVSSTVPRRLVELGLSPTAVLRRSGLPEGLFSQPKVLLTTSELFAFYRGIAESSQDPAIGLRLGTEDRVERYDPVAIAAIYARSFRDALQRMARYKQLTCPEEIRQVERGGECAVQFNWILANEEVEPPLLVDLCFAWVVGIARRGTGWPLNPKRVEFRRLTAHREVYETHFACPVRFGAERNQLVFHREDLDRPFLTHNADVLALVAPRLEEELKQRLDETTVGEQVKGILKRHLAGRRPVLRDVARELRVSSRTLQRRLTSESLTFQQLMEDSRRELARHYLLNSALELSQIAYLVGYEDANSFFRAFHQWEGTPPGEWRACNAGAPSAG